jgi:hypothetical protein
MPPALLTLFIAGSHSAGIVPWAFYAQKFCLRGQKGRAAAEFQIQGFRLPRESGKEGRRKDAV